MITTKQAVEKITTEIINDDELRKGYQANIAMAFYDEYKKQAEARDYIDLGKLDMHEIANKAADNFLKLWCVG